MSGCLSPFFPLPVLHIRHFFPLSGWRFWTLDGCSGIEDQPRAVFYRISSSSLLDKQPGLFWIIVASDQVLTEEHVHDKEMMPQGYMCWP